MFRMLTLVAVLVVVGRSDAAATQALEPQLKLLLNQVSDALEKDVALNDKTVSLGLVASEDRPDNSYGTELRRDVENRLKGKLIAVGVLTLTVNYDLVTSQTDVAEGGKAGEKMKVLIIRAIIKDREKKELFNKSVEVNDAADIGRVLQLTVAPPPNGSQAQRNQSIEEAHNQNLGKKPEEVKPTFQVRKDTQIGIVGNQKFFVEILMKDKPDGPTNALKPTPNPLGNAFVDLKPNQFYDIVIHNNDDFDCIAQIRVDGQDAMNRFNSDGVEYPGLLVPKKSSGTLHGWMHTVKPGAKDNVFAFAVKEYAHGSPTPLTVKGDVGVISVQFAVAWKEGEPRPAGRTIGRNTDKGPALPGNFKVEKRLIGEFNETISVRYSPTAR